MITLHTSGSTDEPKRVTHSWEYINQCAKRSIAEIKLTSKDRVLDVFPLNTIAHWTITGYPSVLSGAEYHCSNFTPYTYLEEFKRIQPSYISLIPRHLELLQATKGFKNLDMSCVRYMVTGSTKIEQEFIDAFKKQGVQLIANWYGMTEFPPPILIGYDSTSFDIQNTPTDDHLMFHPVTATSNLCELIINGRSTGDIFDMNTKTFSHRRTSPNGKTWKNNF